jgi:hypothetical protein
MTALALSRILWGVVAALVLAGCAATRPIKRDLSGPTLPAAVESAVAH